MSAPRFALPVRLLHWAGVVLVVLSVLSGMALDGFPKGSLREGVRVAHYSFGVTLIALTLLRLSLRLITRTPAALPAASPRLGRLAVGVQAVMYASMLLVPVSGLLDRWARDRRVPLFGWSDLPAPFPVPGGKLWGEVHESLAWLLVMLVVAHVLAALWHAFLLRDGTLDRIRLGRRPSGSG